MSQRFRTQRHKLTAYLPIRSGTGHQGRRPGQDAAAAGTVVILAGGSAAAGERYTEERTEWEMDRALLEAERASIEAEPDGEFEELVGIYQAKGLSQELARQVAEELTERTRSPPTPTQSCVSKHSGPRAGHTRGSDRRCLLRDWCGRSARGKTFLPAGERIVLTFVAVLLALGLTGWFAAWLTGLPLLKLVRRNVLLGGTIMAASILVGLALH